MTRRHPADCLARAEKSSCDVDGENFGDRGGSQRLDPREAAGDTGIVDQADKRSELARRGFEKPADGFLSRNVSFDSTARPPARAIASTTSAAPASSRE